MTASAQQQLQYELARARQLQQEARDAIERVKQTESFRKRIVSHPHEFDAWQPRVTALQLGYVLMCDEESDELRAHPAMDDETIEKAQAAWEAAHPELVEKYRLYKC